ncbi:MAG TPA: 16S rRNA (cytidine(1402)-2'-O)-methyltransferase [Anaerolineae bacterium]|nr:16S rRNA (cytidine(1402)-2'-O)-methyltransferase [Anaerolineae bacterium]
MLYLVSTPIGNLGDITLRALETLRMADYVISEDTRKTGLMFKRFDIKKPQISFYAFNELKTLPRLLRLLKEGKSLALVSNAGTPCISDPGFSLVRVAIQEEIEVTAIPGPTALIMALTLSGLPLHSFTFRGFPPRKSAARKRFLQVDKESPHTLVFYESPHRLLSFLEDALVVYGDRQAAVANDLTKKFETVYRGRLSEINKQLSEGKLLGEYTIVIAGSQ